MSLELMVLGSLLVGALLGAVLARRSLIFNLMTIIPIVVISMIIRALQLIEGDPVAARFWAVVPVMFSGGFILVTFGVRFYHFWYHYWLRRADENVRKGRPYNS